MQHHYEGHWKGWALKIETFWAQKSLLSVVVCCCVLEGWGGLLVAVLCEQVFMGGAGWQGSPSPSHYSVGTGIHHTWMLSGGWGGGVLQ